ncbi:acyl-CoA N-acyltransferase [Xylaria sp. CBS 124048]|nr:acyl-CoA N-acyltransferase [Xylaria sp. CBS 124048]
MALPFTAPASLDPSFSMSCPTEVNIEGLAQVYYESFLTDPALTYWWSPDREVMLDWLRTRTRNKLADHTTRHFHVVNSQKETVAYARWDIPAGYEAAFGKLNGIEDGFHGPGGVPDDGTAPTGDLVPKESLVPPKGTDPVPFEAFFSILSRMAAKYDAKGMLGLLLLCTSPQYHRRGAGTALLTPMLAIADSVGLRCYLEASAIGRPLYEKLGFRTVEVQPLDVAALTNGKMEGSTLISIMIREPRNLQGGKETTA